MQGWLLLIHYLFDFIISLLQWLSDFLTARIYAAFAKLTPNGAENCAERKQPHIFELQRQPFEAACFVMQFIR